MTRRKTTLKQAAAFKLAWTKTNIDFLLLLKQNSKSGLFLGGGKLQSVNTLPEKNSEERSLLVNYFAMFAASAQQTKVVVLVDSTNLTNNQSLAGVTQRTQKYFTCHKENRIERRRKFQTTLANCDLSN